MDFGSTNGTFVNGLRISGQVTLNPNDTVRIGGTNLPWQSYFPTPNIQPNYPNYPNNASQPRPPKSHATGIVLGIVGGVLLIGAIIVVIVMNMNSNEYHETPNPLPYSENGVSTNVPGSASQNQSNNKTANQKAVDITGHWTCSSPKTVKGDDGHSIPSWTFDLKLTTSGPNISGDYLVVYPASMKTDGNPGLYDDEDNFDIKGNWDGEKYVVRYQSSWEANVKASIKPISSNQIEWRIISATGGSTFAPDKATLTLVTRNRYR